MNLTNVQPSSTHTHSWHSTVITFSICHWHNVWRSLVWVTGWVAGGSRMNMTLQRDGPRRPAADRCVVNAADGFRWARWVGRIQFLGIGGPGACSASYLFPGMSQTEHKLLRKDGAQMPASASGMCMFMCFSPLFFPHHHAPAWVDVIQPLLCVSVALWSHEILQWWRAQEDSGGNDAGARKGFH